MLHKYRCTCTGVSIKFEVGSCLKKNNRLYEQGAVHTPYSKMAATQDVWVELHENEASRATEHNAPNRPRSIYQYSNMVPRLSGQKL